MYDTAPSITISVQNRFHVVLVEPGDSLNVGSVARAMHNLGFTNLHLVAPPRYDRERAERTACHATTLLDDFKVYDSLKDCLAQFDDVVGFTAESGRNRRSLVNLGAWSALVTEQERASRVALLFGPEDTGLRREHIAECRQLVRIPSNAENPSFNLAQAVLLALLN